MKLRKILSGLIALIFSAMLLTACSETVATPTPAQSQPVAVVTPASVPSQPQLNQNVQTTQANDQSATSSTQTQPPHTQKAAVAPVGTGTANGFYELPYADSEFFVHVPTSLKAGRPAQVVLAIHGMNSNGQQFATPLISYADRYNLILVAPTLKYDQDYLDPDHIAANDSLLLPELDGLLNALPNQIHLAINPKVLLFGFSRGAQIVHRFAYFYPEKVLGVALMSAGNYTLPEQNLPQAGSPASAAAKISLPFPFGIADMPAYSGHAFNMVALRQIPFWLAVGGADNAIKDVPPAWSPYLGETRIERATHYYQALQTAGINVTLTVVPGVGHTVCTEMKQGAFSFFDKLVA